MKTFSIMYLLLIMIACHIKAKNETKNTLSKPENELSLDLREIQNTFGVTRTLEVKEDPVYHKTKTYNTIVFRDLLTKHFNLSALKITDYKMVFECEDGYKPEMPLDKLLMANAYLAISDVAALKGEKWEQIVKDGHKMNAAPFYVVYQGISPNDGSYKWPYNLIKLHLEPIDSDLALTMPKCEEAQKGYAVFKLQCQTCHAVNGVGGQMGPEMNYPKNITEYWEESHLKAFIKNPAAYRNGVKMPTLQVSDTDVNEIVAYLKCMKNQKLNHK